jgi:hypothetical protein
MGLLYLFLFWFAACLPVTSEMLKWVIRLQVFIKQNDDHVDTCRIKGRIFPHVSK